MKLQRKQKDKKNNKQRDDLKQKVVSQNEQLATIRKQLATLEKEKASLEDEIQTFRQTVNKWQGKKMSRWKVEDLFQWQENHLSQFQSLQQEIKRRLKKTLHNTAEPSPV